MVLLYSMHCEPIIHCVKLVYVYQSTDPEGDHQASEMLTHNASELMTMVKEAVDKTETAALYIPPEEGKKLGIQVEKIIVEKEV